MQRARTLVVPVRTPDLNVSVLDQRCCPIRAAAELKSAAVIAHLYSLLSFGRVTSLPGECHEKDKDDRSRTHWCSDVVRSSLFVAPVTTATFVGIRGQCLCPSGATANSGQRRRRSPAGGATLCVWRDLLTEGALGACSGQYARTLF